MRRPFKVVIYDHNGVATAHRFATEAEAKFFYRGAVAQVARGEAKSCVRAENYSQTLEACFMDEEPAPRPAATASGRPA